MRRTVVLLAFLVHVAAASAQVPSPVLEGPITSPGSAFLATTSFDLAEVGYVQEEFFASGRATAYTNAGALGEDGMWSVVPASTADYKTRFVVHRPADKKKFNGTVVVEWLNVSGGADAAPDWTLAHVQLVREGFAWVGVSAQFVGIEGGGGLLGVADLPLKTVNPARYGSLVHPGDSFSYDIYSQTAQAVRQPSGASPLGDLVPKRVIAIGESQSAFRLVTYVNAIHPLTRLYDGYFIHSRGAFPVPLSEAPQPVIPVPGTARIRSDIDVPVLTFETETDLTFLGYADARQEDAENFRLWEVAGTAHADTYTLLGGTDLGDSPDIVQPVELAEPLPGFIECTTPINSGPQHFVVKAAISALNRWVKRGKAPKPAPRIEFADGVIQTDANGNALGGIRTPQVDVPIATFTGEQEGTILCRLFGTTTLFDDAKLAALYPSRKSFLKPYNKSLRRAVKAGWIVKADAKLMKRWARASGIGG